MGFPVSSVTAKIYMEYFKEMTLGPECPIPSSWWRQHVDDDISIVKKNKADTFFNHLNLVDPQIIFTMESST